MSHVEYITDEADSIASYKTRGTALQNTPMLEKLTEGLDRFSKGEVMMGYDYTVSVNHHWLTF